jgi:RNA recognition motif-containing protein
MPGVAGPTHGGDASGGTGKKPVKRVAAGKVWVDESLAEWPDNDFRIFVGNLARDVTDAQLYEHFQQLYDSTAMAKVVKDKAGLSKGYGFVSFLQPLDCARAIREQDQKWLGSRPIRVKRSDWKDRNLNTVQKKQKKEAKKQKRFGGV